MSYSLVEPEEIGLESNPRLDYDLTIVVARSANFVIGGNGGLLWHIPEDLKHFKKTTSKKFVIMGRKTYESIGRPLPDRWNLVVSRNPDLKIPGAAVFESLEAALCFATSALDVAELNGYSREICLIGGGELYQEGLKYANKIIVTEINFQVEGDTTFIFDKTDWNIVEPAHTPSSPPWDVDYQVVTYKRTNPTTPLYQE